MEGSEKAGPIFANRGFFNTFQPIQQFVPLSALMISAVLRWLLLPLPPSRRLP